MSDVIDTFIESEVFESLEFLVTGRRREDARAGALGHLYCRNTNAPRTRVDEGRLVGRETPEFEQAIVRSSEGHRHARAIFQSDIVGESPREGLTRDAQLRVRSVNPRRDDAVADSNRGDVLTHRQNHTRTLITNDVWNLVHLTAKSIERVTALNAYEGDLYEDVTRSRDGIGASSYRKTPGAPVS